MVTILQSYSAASTMIRFFSVLVQTLQLPSGALALCRGINMAAAQCCSRFVSWHKCGNCPVLLSLCVMVLTLQPHNSALALCRGIDVAAAR